MAGSKKTEGAPLYAAQLALKGVGVLVVGGGEVALRKTRSLLEAQASVRVVAPEFHAEFSALKSVKNLRLIRRVFKAADLRGARLVFAATHDPRLNSRIANAAKKKGLLVNVAAPPEAGNFHVPASVRRGRLSIAISTGGASAALARALRERIEKTVGAEWGELAELLDERRARLLSEFQDAQARHALFCKLGSPRWAKVIKQRGASAAASEMDAFIQACVRRAAKSTSRNGAATRKRAP